jgi:AraC-like DNA-binding protein
MPLDDALDETRNTVWLSEPLRRRESYEGRTALLQEVPLIGCLDLHQAVKHALPGHLHTGIVEVHFVRTGSLSMWVEARERMYTVRGGQAFLTLSNQLHGGEGGLIKRAGFSWLQVRVPTRADRPLPGLSVSQTRLLLKPFVAYGVPPVFTYSAVTGACFERFIGEYRRRRPDSAVMARFLLHELLALLGRDYRESLVQLKSCEAGVSASVQRAIHWLAANPGERTTVARMAKAAGMSERHFRSHFTQETGFTPADYAARRLVERARELLIMNERSVTDIAYELGFCTSAYFAAFFRRYTGQTPSGFRSEYGRRESHGTSKGGVDRAND